MAPAFSPDTSEDEEDDDENQLLLVNGSEDPTTTTNNSPNNNGPTTSSDDEQEAAVSTACRPQPKPVVARKTNFTVKDDEILAQAWVKVSEDGVKGKDQKSGLFWNTITEFFNQRMAAENRRPRTSSSLCSRWAFVRQSAKMFLHVDKKHVMASGANLTLHRAKVVSSYNDFVEKKKKESPSTKLKPVKPEDGDAYYQLYVDFLGTKVKFANPAKQGIARPTKGNRALVSSEKARKKARGVMSQCGIPVDSSNNQAAIQATTTGGATAAAVAAPSPPTALDSFMSNMAEQQSSMLKVLSSSLQQQAQANQFNQQLMTTALTAAVQIFGSGGGVAAAFGNHQQQHPLAPPGAAVGFGNAVASHQGAASTPNVFGGTTTTTVAVPTYNASPDVVETPARTNEDGRQNELRQPDYTGV